MPETRSLYFLPCLSYNFDRKGRRTGIKERKYKEDWINETRFDDRGKETRVPVYRGAWFRLPQKVSRKTLLLLSAVPWGLFLLLILGYFKLNFPGATTLYVFLPAALGLFPALYWALGLWGMLRAPEKMTRLQKENGIGRVLRSAVGCAVCACGATIGDAVFLLIGGSASREWPGALMLSFSALVAFFAVSRFRLISSQMIEEKEAGK